ncbi:hypothetical protein HY631_01245 [Candidatus Uhrbacteria bacterium]|nr:hypothetical protein [Candidatus Uhrbacteria bacterium]
MEPIHGCRLSRTAVRERAAQADRRLREGLHERRVARELGYLTIHALRQSVRRYRLVNNIKVERGWLKLYRLPPNSVRLILGARALNCCGWKDGTVVEWRAGADTITLKRYKPPSAKDVFYDPTDPDSVAYYLHRVQGVSIRATAQRLKTSRSTVHRMILRHASKHPALLVYLRAPTQARGLVRVRQVKGRLQLVVIQAVERMHWGSCDIVRWEYEKTTRTLRIVHEISAASQTD